MSLKSLREEAGLSQGELARKIGVTQGYISQLENPIYKKNATVEIIDKLAVALNICPPIIYMHFSSLCSNCKFCCHCRYNNKK